MTQPNNPLPCLCLRKARVYRAAILLATLQRSQLQPKVHHADITDL